MTFVCGRIRLFLSMHLQIAMRSWDAWLEQFSPAENRKGMGNWSMFAWKTCKFKEAVRGEGCVRGARGMQSLIMWSVKSLIRLNSLTPALCTDAAIDFLLWFCWRKNKSKSKILSLKHLYTKNWVLELKKYCSIIKTPKDVTVISNIVFFLYFLP